MTKASQAKNILFIMYDQLRWDYLSCAGHPYLHTPNFDWVASQGVRFDRCYVQSPQCGSSRMSTYTGRYVASHGATWNGVPLRVGEPTMGDHLRDVGMECVLIGKTHMKADWDGIERLGIAPDGIIGVRVRECGFDPHVRDDGMVPTGPNGPYNPEIGLDSAYNKYMWAKGYESPNPWHDFANSAVDDEGNVLSGFELMNAKLPANVREEDSETPWLTSEIINWLEARGEQPDADPWCVHLSYIKPHWPYIVPAPYHDMYGPEHFLPPVQGSAEREDPHPLLARFQNAPMAKTHSSDPGREATLGAYMGLIKQCDDQLGRLLNYLQQSGQIETTMIVLTSDHGDYLGDHYLAEKGLFHDCSLRVPLIVCDPSPECDGTRGTVSQALVEAIDLAPTFVEFRAGAETAADKAHILEGRSLMPLLRGELTDHREFRDYAISEYDFAFTPVRECLELSVEESRWFAVVSERWKYVQFRAEDKLPPMLFDLQDDPDELNNLGASEDLLHLAAMADGRQKLEHWALRISQRITKSDHDIKTATGSSQARGVTLGFWQTDETTEHLFVKYRGKVSQRFTPEDK